MGQVTAIAGYEPKPGTVAFHALAHLETLPPGAELMNSALAEAIGIDGKTLTICLKPALSHGGIFARKRDAHQRSPMWWSLVDHSQPNTPEGADRAPQVLKAEPARADATAGEARNEVMAPQGSESPAGRGTHGAPALGVAPVFLPRAGATQFALWSTGALQINRPNAVGGASEIVLLSPDETRQLVRYLDSISLDSLRDE